MLPLFTITLLFLALFKANTIFCQVMGLQAIHSLTTVRFWFLAQLLLTICFGHCCCSGAVLQKDCNCFVVIICVFIGVCICFCLCFVLDRSVLCCCLRRLQCDPAAKQSGFDAGRRVTRPGPTRPGGLGPRVSLKNTHKSCRKCAVYNCSRQQNDGNIWREYKNITYWIQNEVHWRFFADRVEISRRRS